MFVFIWWKGWYLSCLAFFEIPGFVICHLLGKAHGDPLQYSCLENPHGQRSLVGYSPWGHKESDTTKWLSMAHINFRKFSGNITSWTSSVISFLPSPFGISVTHMFSVYISVWEVSIDKFPSSVIPFLIFVQSNHDQMEDILHFYYFVFDLQNLFLFFLRPSIHIICFCIWSTFFL